MNTHRPLRTAITGTLTALLLFAATSLTQAQEVRTESPAPSNTLSKAAATASGAAAAVLTPRAACLAGAASLSGVGDQSMVYTAGLQAFPSSGSSDYLVLSTGYASMTAGTAPTYVSHNMGGPQLAPAVPYGSPDGVRSYDVVTFSVPFAVPSGSSATLSFDWQFGSEENPTWTSSYTDYFRADVFDGAMNHLGNIALLPNNAQVTTSSAAAYSNAPGGSSASPSPPFPTPNDVVYNAMTGKYTASIDLSSYTGQTVTVQFRIADARDGVLNSVVFIDNLDLAVCPNASFTLDPNMLWPPNHKMKTINVTANGVPSCFSWTLAGVSSNEPDNGEDDGDTVDDIQDVDAGTADGSFMVRAERSGIGTGRVYTATFLVTDANGQSCTYTSTVSVPLSMTPKAPANSVSIPNVATLEQNYPNPFNPSTTIAYNLHVDAEVSLRVYDLFGRELANLVSGMQSAGSYSVPFDASALASGMYIYQLTVDGTSLQRSMNLMK